MAYPATQYEIWTQPLTGGPRQLQGRVFTEQADAELAASMQAACLVEVWEITYQDVEVAGAGTLTRRTTTLVQTIEVE